MFLLDGMRSALTTVTSPACIAFDRQARYNAPGPGFTGTKSMSRLISFPEAVHTETILTMILNLLEPPDLRPRTALLGGNRRAQERRAATPLFNVNVLMWKFSTNLRSFIVRYVLQLITLSFQFARSPPVAQRDCTNLTNSRS